MIDAASVESLVRFWFAIGLCGWLAWPLAALLLPDDRDSGYLAAKPLGYLIASYAAWAASLAGISFWQYGWMAGLAALAMLFSVTLKPRRIVLHVRRLLQWETAFLALLLVGVLIKGSAPEILGLEKFMDFGFLNAALRATTMPPPDPWWSGAPINYYYFGHVAAAWLVQLSGVPSDHGFNLMIALLFAFAATLSYRIINGCLAPSEGRVAMVCAAAGSALVTLGGNCHSVLYGPFRPFSSTSYDRDFYYPDSTRFVGFDPPTGDKGFTEMPAYGFAVGDLHSHMLNLPTTLLMVLLFARLVQRPGAAGVQNGVLPLEAAILALLFSVSAMCNSWDALSYGILMGLTGLVLVAQAPRNRLGLFVRIAGWALLIIVGAATLAAPFLIVFKPIASEFRWSDAHTPLWQLAVLYGHLVLPFALLLACALTPLRHDPRWRVALLLAVFAACLIALPEILYVKDIYGEDHRRANTMFKLTFQAQPVAMMASAIAIGLLLQQRSILAGAAAVVAAVPLLATLSYSESMYRGRVTPVGSRNFTLGGFGFLAGDRTDDKPLVDWLRSQPADRHILLVEAPGDSFTYDSRLSALSGVPAVLGWRGHEWLWRGDAAAFARSDEISAFYGSKSLGEACSFVIAHGVTHVAIGTVEREKFPQLDQRVLETLGPSVVRGGNSTILEIDPLACND